MFSMGHRLIVWCLTPFSTVFQLYHGGQCTYSCFPGVLVTSTQHNILSKPLATFPHNNVRTTDSGERGMNPVAMTIINPRKEYWPSRGSNQRPPVLKSATLPTELWGSAKSEFNRNRPIDSSQPAQSAQADRSQNRLLVY